MNNFSGHEEAAPKFGKKLFLEKVVENLEKWIPLWIKSLGNRYDTPEAISNDLVTILYVYDKLITAKPRIPQIS